MYPGYILVCMRTTLNIDDALLREARRLSGIVEKTALVHAGLEALVARESARRLAALGGSEPRLRAVPRRPPAEPAAARRPVLASRRKPRGTR